MNEALPTLRIIAAAHDVARVSVRRHQFDVGRPLHFDAEYPQITAIEYALGAVGAEIVGGLRSFAARRRLVLDQIEAVVHGELENALTYLEVVGEAGSPALSRVNVKVYVSSPDDTGAVRQLWEDVLARLPLVCSLRKCFPLDLVLTLI